MYVTFSSINVKIIIWRESIWLLEVPKILHSTYGTWKIAKLPSFKKYVEEDTLSWPGVQQAIVFWRVHQARCSSKTFLSVRISRRFHLLIFFMQNLGNSNLVSRNLGCDGRSCPGSCLESMWNQGNFCRFGSTYMLLYFGWSCVSVGRKKHTCIEGICYSLSDLILIASWMYVK